MCCMAILPLCLTVQSLINYYLPRLEHRSQDSLKFFSVDPIRPEKVKSAELGFRPTLFDRVYIDANYYYSEYTDFIGYKVGVKYLSDTSNGGYNISLPSSYNFLISFIIKLDLGK